MEYKTKKYKYAEEIKDKIISIKILSKSWKNYKIYREYKQVRQKIKYKLFSQIDYIRDKKFKNSDFKYSN